MHMSKKCITFAAPIKILKMNKLIGRTKECDELRKIEKSGQAEFVALYGRRRVGKTFLVNTYFRNRFSFATSGIIGGIKAEEMAAFYSSLVQYGFEGKQPKTWMELFAALRVVIEQKKGKGRRVVFIDELPCLDTHGSDFIHALDFFWNSWGCKQSNLLLIVCGSATSWIIRNIVDNKGGLHNRLTHTIHLHAFNLKEAAALIRNKGGLWSNQAVLQVYMAMGGVPYYLNMIDPVLSPAQNIDQLFFADDAPLKTEYSHLYKSLFRSPERYMKLVALLAKEKKGLTRNEIIHKLRLNDSGHIGDLLEDLVNCDFIRYYYVINKKLKRNEGIYQLTDLYSLFYFDYLQKGTTNEQYWSFHVGTEEQNSWYGFAFERVCMTHIEQIKRALRIDKVYSEYYSWRSRESSPASQIDLLIDRADNMINLCEIKYSTDEYVMTKQEASKIQHRITSFRSETQTHKGIVTTLITTKALHKNIHSSIIQSVVKLADLLK